MTNEELLNQLFAKIEKMTDDMHNIRLDVSTLKITQTALINSLQIDVTELKKKYIENSGRLKTLEDNKTRATGWLDSAKVVWGVLVALLTCAANQLFNWWKHHQ